MSHGDVRGVDLDAKTRCAHYHADSDVVALKFGCCAEYYACHRCHEELTTHDAEPWPSERREEPAVRCGVCAELLAPTEYMNVDACPGCETAFNPGCADHYHLYFAWVDSPARRVSRSETDPG